MVAALQKKDVFNFCLPSEKKKMNFEKNFYCVSSRIEKNGQLYGCFKIGPFFEHHSLTFANTLRRTLLADQSKYTFNAVQIYGVTHEFSHLKGLRESIIDLLLNLEKIVFQTIQPLTKPQIAFIYSYGPKIIRAQHIYLPPGWRCVRPDQYIATLEIDGQLFIKLFFSPNFTQLGNPILQRSSSQSKLHRQTQQIHSMKKINCFSNNFYLAFLSPPFKNWPIFEKLANFHHLKHFVLPSKKKNLSLKKNIFQKQENFLFLKNSLCAIEKAHYTLQKDNHQSFPTTSIFFELWTDGSLHPQTAIFKALKEILLDIFSYSLQITKSAKIPFLKKKEITKFSTVQFQEKFLNMEIGNFCLDLETAIFLKKKKIYKIVDFCHFFQSANCSHSSPSVKKILYKFYLFILSILQ